MPKSCMKKRKTTHRVSFNKVVGVNKGKRKKLKSVNVTNLVFDILRKKGPIDTAYLKGAVEKHKQHGSTEVAIKQSIKRLSKIKKKVCKSETPYIGSCKILVPENIIHRLGDAKNKLKYIKV